MFAQDYDIGFGLEYEMAAEGEGKAPVVRNVISVERVDATQTVVSGRSSEKSPGFWFLVFDNS
jgi:hypothetical protein